MTYCLYSWHMQAEILILHTVKKLIPPQLTPVFTQRRQMNEIQNRPDMRTVYPSGVKLGNKALKEACVRKPPLLLSSPEHPFSPVFGVVQRAHWATTHTNHCALQPRLYYAVQAMSSQNSTGESSKAGCARQGSLQHFSFKASIL